MKQILLTLSLFISLSINAQIQRTFYGLELGVATKTQVTDKLKSLGKQYTTKVDEIKTHNMKLGGYEWADVGFAFQDGKLLGVVFVSRKYPKGDGGADALILKGLLEDKYKEYSMLNLNQAVAYKDDETIAFFLISKKYNHTEQFFLIYADGLEAMELIRKSQSDL